MTTQREPDTSAEGRALAHFADDVRMRMQTVTIESGEPVLHVYDRCVAAALADAAGQAAPVPPPVEGPDRNWLHRLLMHHAEAAKEQGDDLGATVYLAVEERDAIIAAHDRAEGLANEVERLKAEGVERYVNAVKQFSDALTAAGAKLAVYEAPRIGADGPTLYGQSVEIDRLTAEVSALSAAHAECKGENTKLREAMVRAFQQADRNWAYGAASTLRTALAPASEEKTT